MSTAQLVVQHLPYLRRYARALTGSQVAGDAYVAATLETLVNEPETLGRSTNVKVSTDLGGAGIPATTPKATGRPPTRREASASAGRTSTACVGLSCTPAVRVSAARCWG